MKWRLYYIMMMVFAFWGGISAVAQQAGEHASGYAKEKPIYVRDAHISKAGNRLLVTLSLKIDENLDSNRSLVLLPLLSDSSGNFATLPTIYVSGRRQQIYRERNSGGVDDKSVYLRKKKKTAIEYDYIQALNYEAWMSKASLFLREQNCGCDILKENGVAWLDKMEDKKEFEPILHFITPDVEAGKIREEKGKAHLQFRVNNSQIDPDYKNNKAELLKIRNTVNLVRNDTMVEIRKICIHGYASPEGLYKNNDRLGYERTMALKEYLNELYCFDDSVIHFDYTVEDWDGFLKMLNDSVCPQQKEMLKVAQKELLPDRKEEMLRKNAPDGFRFVVDRWFPYLRKTEYAVSYLVRPFSEEEAKREFALNPKKLSLDEIYRLANTYPENSSEYNDIFKKAAVLFPDDAIANYNAACVSLKENNLVEAEEFLNRVPDIPQKKNALGVLMVLQGKYEEAIEILKEANEEHVKGALQNLKQIF